MNDSWNRPSDVPAVQLAMSAHVTARTEAWLLPVLLVVLPIDHNEGMVTD